MKKDSLFGLIEKFPNESTCIKYLESVRWENGPVSPFDNTSKVYKCKNGYVCRKTGKRFNIKHGTLFHRSKLPLRTWFLAMYLFTNNKRGISSVQLGKILGVRQATAWEMLTKIRESMEFFNIPDPESTEAWVIDETVIGGKYPNKHKDKIKGRTGEERQWNDKTWVMGMMQKDGNVVLQVVPDTLQVTLQTVVWNTVPLGSTIYTDEWRGYFNLREDYDHGVVRHSEKQYINGEITTNPIEAFWSHLKRTYHGTYFHWSVKHMQKYCYEAAFRFNTRYLSENDRFDFLMKYC